MNKYYLFLLQFLNYLWYFCLFVILTPWLVIQIGESLDWLFLKFMLSFSVPRSSLILFLPPILTMVAGILATFGAALIVQAFYVLIREGESFPFTILFHKHLAPRKLVTTGPYRWVRHPMLLGYGLVLVGLGIYRGSLLTVFWVVPLLLWAFLETVIITEERQLLAWFGGEYVEYRQKTPSLIPRLKPGEELHS